MATHPPAPQKTKRFKEKKGKTPKRRGKRSPHPTHTATSEQQPNILKQ